MSSLRIILLLAKIENHSDSEKSHRTLSANEVIINNCIELTTLSNEAIGEMRRTWGEAKAGCIN